MKPKKKTPVKKRKNVSAVKKSVRAQHKSISVTEARKTLGEVFCEVNYQKERIVLTSHKKSVAIVPLEDLKLLEALEDAQDIHEAKLALKEIKEKGSISFEEMKKRVS